jgi:hypothetical protein
MQGCSTGGGCSGKSSSSAACNAPGLVEEPQRTFSPGHLPQHHAVKWWLQLAELGEAVWFLLQCARTSLGAAALPDRLAVPAVAADSSGGWRRQQQQAMAVAVAPILCKLWKDTTATGGKQRQQQAAYAGLGIACLRVGACESDVCACAESAGMCDVCALPGGSLLAWL